MCDNEQLTDLDEAQAAFHVTANAKAARKAFNFIDRYTAANGRRPSLSSIVMLWQQAEAKLALAQVALAEAALVEVEPVEPPGDPDQII